MVAITLFNGFCLGLERTINRPIWAIHETDEGEAWGLAEFSGVVVYLACFRFMFGSIDTFADLEE